MPEDAIVSYEYAYEYHVKTKNSIVTYVGTQRIHTCAPWIQYDIGHRGRPTMAHRDTPRLLGVLAG